MIDAYIAGECHGLGGVIEHAVIGEDLDPRVRLELHVALDNELLFLSLIAAAVRGQAHAGVRDGTHRNSEEITPKDPVQLGLCPLKDLNIEIEKSNTKMRNKEQAMANARAELAQRDTEEASNPGGF